jgi:uncharacterized membrane protein YuzA (DUF378 family)
MKWISVLALVLVVVGAINWGLWAIAELDLVAELFGGNTEPLSRVVYGLVGLAGLYTLAITTRIARQP